MKSTDTSTLSRLFLEHASISGTFSPDKLFNHVLKECGKVDYLAVFILSDIIYWHRPDKDGNSKFKGTSLQKSYDDYAKKYNAPKRTVKASFDLLEELGFITRDFKTIVLYSGQKVSNVMYIELNISMLVKIFNDSAESSHKDELAHFSKEVMIYPPSEEKSSYEANMDDFGYTYDNTVANVSQICVGGPTENCNTNTDTNNKTIKDNVISFISVQDRPERSNCDEMNEERVREVLSKNTDIDALIKEQPSSAGNYREYFEVMVDLCCYNKRSMKILGNVYSAEAIRNRMFMLKREHLEYVCEKYENYVGNITDYHAHITATLYRSYFEVNSYVTNLRHNIDYERSMGVM